jgi:hypothetical protein
MKLGHTRVNLPIGEDVQVAPIVRKHPVPGVVAGIVTKEVLAFVASAILPVSVRAEFSTGWETATLKSPASCATILARQQLRLMHAMRLLADGAKVTHAALDAGYNSPSAFISMFRRALGTTPRRYFAIGKRADE